MSRANPQVPSHSWDTVSVLRRAVDKGYGQWLRRNYPFRSIGRHISIHYPCVINKLAAPRISIGNSVIIRKDTWLNCLLDESTGVKLFIGDRCCIGTRNHISVKNQIYIAESVITSSGVVIQDHNHAYEDIEIPVRDQGVTEGGTIHIGEGSWIGHGAAIICSRGNLTLGQHCVVGANAVVTRSAPPYSVLAGNPARIIKQYDPEMKSWVLASARSDDPEIEQEQFADKY